MIAGAAMALRRSAWSRMLCCCGALLSGSGPEEISATSAMITIGEAASRSGVPPKTIRFYEEAGIIARAVRSENRYRTHSDADIQTLRFIHRAQPRLYAQGSH